MTEPKTKRPLIVGVVMAGGLSRRMGGGDKFDIKLKEKSLLDRVVERAQPQVDRLILNTNSDPDRFEYLRLPVIPDSVPGYAGPLAGILSGMEWVKAHEPECRFIASFACDTPFFPLDLVSRLYAEMVNDQADIACAESGGRLHPVFGLWPVRLCESLRTALVEEQLRKMGAWLQRYRCVEVGYSCEPFDPFFNINRPEDLALAQSMA